MSVLRTLSLWQYTQKERIKGGNLQSCPRMNGFAIRPDRCVVARKKPECCVKERWSALLTQLGDSVRSRRVHREAPLFSIFCSPKIEVPGNSSPRTSTLIDAAAILSLDSLSLSFDRSPTEVAGHSNHEGRTGPITSVWQQKHTSYDDCMSRIVHMCQCSKRATECMVSSVVFVQYMPARAA